MFSKSSLSLGIAAALVLSGCGGGGGGSSSTGDETASGETTVVSGRAADGYLSQARVFIDLNNNGTLDSDEALAKLNEWSVLTEHPNWNENGL